MQIAFFKTAARRIPLIARAILLTLTIGWSGCALITEHAGESCNTRAYIRTDLAGFIDQRFKGGTTARMAVVPFTTQANFTAQNSELPGISDQLAWGVHRELLSYETLPIIEVFNRQDWPGQKDDFFTGNFGALSLAKDAGYDLILLGYMDRITRLDTWVIHTKIIDVDSGTTLWYGTSRIVTNEPDFYEVSGTFGLTSQRPDQLYISPMLNKAASCIAHDIMIDPELEG